MTNSIASAKCPSILTSGKYGMSQRRSIVDDSKEYIFVKLTDSAVRAIEEYQRNAQSKRLQKGQCAKIQFVGNTGVIQFPSTADGSASNGGSSDGRKFGFAIDDVEGSLECIQQSGTDLDVLGSLNYRMRIHANDDVYDTTRTKMAIAEETEKSKCIREIKPNQTDIGRKVKRPISAASMQAYTNGTTSTSLLNSLPNGNGISGGNSNSININGSSSYLSSSTNHTSGNVSNNNSRNKLSSTSLNQHSPPLVAVNGGPSGSVIGVNGSRLLSNASSLRSSPNPSIVGGNGTVANSSNRYGSPLNLTSSNLTTPSNILNGGGNYSPPGCGSNHITNSLQKKSNMGANSKGTVGKGSLGNNGKINGISNGKNLDVSRRKIRERLIHLLALKPFKKPELYSRLQNEGLAPRERQLISTILKDISTLSRDNTYNLRRSMWNDVDENWPFFSEQEMQQLKRRKPQNLTPPTSSDAGSSMSGQSPTSSTHTGSPPPSLSSANMNGVGGNNGIKRTSLEPDSYDATLTLGMQSKKQRISHYKKDGISSGNNLTNNSSFGTGPRINLGVGSNSNSYNQTYRSSSASYSPHTNNTGNNNGNDESFGNSDLSFSVLNNMDDFVQHTANIGGDSTFVSRSKIITSSSNTAPSYTSSGASNSNSGNNITNNINNNSTSQTAAKEKRNSNGSCNSSGYGSNRESSSLPTTAMRRKTSPTPYSNNFVPETKISSNSNGSNSNCRLNKPQMQKKQQQSSPSYNNPNNHYSHKSTNNSSNSVIPRIQDDYSPPLAPSTSHTTNKNNANSSSNRSRHRLSSSTTNDHCSGESTASNKPPRSSTPTQKLINRHSNSSSKNNVTTSTIPQELQNNDHNHLSVHHQQDDPHLLNESRRSPQIASQQSQQQEHSSPTQQIAAAASTFSLTNHSTASGDASRYDFSSYTPITSIEQRRKYKTEFESDYDEYRKLLAQIESVGHRFRELADRLSRVQQGCIDYYNIKDQIVSEYNRIRKEEAINRDKQRFDYLHEKLAHIKQLVMDYDKKLTSGMATTTSATKQQHPQNEYPNQQLQSTVANNSAHLSPMLQSSGESNHSPPLMIMTPTSGSVDTTKHSLTTTTSSKKSSKHQQKSQKQERLKQHHEPETIHMVGDNEDSDEEETTSTLHYRQYSYDAGDNHVNQQQHLSPTTSTNTHENRKEHKLELFQNVHQTASQQIQNHNSNDSDSDSDSTSSSSSNDDDNSDDDNSDASDDNSENGSNDEYNDQ